MKSSIREAIEATKIIPVVVVESVENGVKIMDALVEGGLCAAEITFRTECAKDALKAMCEKYPDACIGAGTILNVAQAKDAIDAGAKFIVSPGLSKEVVEYCQSVDVLVIPGCMTPTNVQDAIALGLDFVKFFPAESAGGLGLLKAISEPYNKVKFMPTGGITPEKMDSYLSFNKVLACGGSFITKPAKTGDYEAVTREARKAVELASKYKN